MAILKSIASGNFSAAATWGVIHVNGTGGSSSFLDSRTSLQGATTTLVASTSFQVGSNLNCLGVAVQVGYRATTPTAGSTVTVQLWNATTSAQVDVVTINITDLPKTNLVNDIGWVYFKFGSSRALTTGTNYQIRISSSHNNHFFAYRDATSNNWNRAIITDVTQAPGASDTLLINGEHTGAGANSTFTVTMDLTTATSTVYGLTYVDNKGFFIYGTNASTNYRYQLNGNLFVRGYGKLEIGNSGALFPSSSTAELQFQPTTSGGIGIQNQCGDVYLYGATKTVYRAKLGATANAAATSLTTDVSTGWLNGDIIVIASTSRTATEREHRTMNANAVGTTVTISSGLSFQHLANLENLISADIGNLTRNVKIRSNSATNTFVINCSGFQTEFYANQVEFENGGSTSTAAISLGATLTDGKFEIKNCSIYNLTTVTNLGSTIANQGTASPKPTILFQNNVYYGYQNSNYGFGFNNTITSTVDTTVIIDNLFVNTNFAARMFNLVCTGNTFTSSSSSTVIEINTQQQNNITITHRDGAFDNTTIYSTAGTGLITLNLIVSNSQDIYMRNLIIARASAYGISNGHYGTRMPSNFTGNTNFIIKDFKIFGCGNGGINIGSTANGGYILEDGYIWRGSATLSMPRAFDISPFLCFNVFANNIICGVTPSGIQDSFTNENLRIPAGSGYGGKIIFSNCIFSGGTEMNNTGGANYSFDGGYLVSLNHNKVSGSNKIFGNCGIMQSDTTFFKTSSPSIRIIPQTSSFKMISGEFKVAVNASSSANISVWIRKSATADGSNYNGSQPRIVCRRNYAAGNNFKINQVIATTTVANGTWEQVQGTTPIVDNDCILSFYVDCDGTVGWINIDDITTSTSNDTRGTKYWGEFYPYLEPDYSTGGGGGGGEKSFVFLA